MHLYTISGDYFGQRWNQGTFGFQFSQGGLMDGAVAAEYPPQIYVM
jgi:hypothetical protein